MKTCMYTRPAFISFAGKMDIPLKLAENIIDELTGKEDAVRDLLSRSFLSDEAKIAYLKFFTARQIRLKSI